MNIDVVYTWVDGGDPVWHARKVQTLQAHGQAAPTVSSHAARFHSAGEIRHSIASILTYAPWVRRIFVVTDGQRPTWLTSLSPKVTVIDHEDIFSDSAWLPCFASRGIESQLHHIDGLAEHYLSFNDDMFLGRPVSPQGFFDRRGRPKVFTNTRRPRPRPWHAQPDLVPPDIDQLHVGSVEFTRQLVHKVTGHLIGYDIRHQAKAQSRSLMLEAEQVFQDEFARVASSPFRLPGTIVPAYLHAFYGLATGRAVPHYVRSIRAHASWKDHLVRLFALDDSSLVSHKGPDRHAKLERLLAIRPKFMCINPTEMSDSADLERLISVMNQLWPVDDPRHYA